MKEGYDGGPTLFRLVRFWSRRWAGQASEELTGELRHVQHIMVIEAVATNTHPAGAAPVAGAHEAVTVGTVAHRLGLDHSGASRMVRDAVEAGYLVRATSERDRRRAALRLTESGQELLAGARQWQRQAFEELTASWAERDRRQFASYLQRLADDVGA
ncbi:MarR family winged helix-turn-helix transcriptional regulator [Streptosporangium roseum]|uniref:MarR family winged helix-turn-helix transcriptional regulator n=1 Tax=Streptosporangium roseum TaxID=2001 RepID=UPI0004CCD9A9|nr:MarR family winged helix-turn-helix transcriptional regulator [Streptosporangium roseum]